jgi:hypothetical protein
VAVPSFPPVGVTPLIINRISLIASRVDFVPGCFTPLGVENNRKEVKRQKEKREITKIAAVVFGFFAMTIFS